MRRFSMNPDNTTQEKMTDALEYASLRYNLNHSVIDYLQTHLTTNVPHVLLDGFLSDEHEAQLAEIQQNALEEYDGNTRHISSMIEAVGVDGRVSQSVNLELQMVTIDWTNFRGRYESFDSDIARSEYARIREIAENNRENTIRVLVRNEFAEEMKRR